jgi:hypothetical protein
MEYSLPAWLGALIGAVVAVVVYVPAISALARHLRTQAGPQTLEEHKAFEEKFSIARRLILAVDVAIFATVGYWIGLVLGGPRY